VNFNQTFINKFHPEALAEKIQHEEQKKVNSSPIRCHTQGRSRISKLTQLQNDSNWVEHLVSYRHDFSTMFNMQDYANRVDNA